MRIYYVIGFFFFAALISYFIHLNQERLENRIGDNYRNSLTTPKNAEKKPQIQPFEFMGTFSDLAAKGVAARCEYNFQEGIITIKGVAFTDGSNLRASSTVTAEASILISNILLRDNQYFYWSGSNPNGFFVAKDTAESSPSASVNTGREIKKYFKFSCEGWEKTDSMFNVPASVSFVDLETAIDLVNTDPCSACLNISDTNRKALCRKSYNCD